MRIIHVVALAWLAFTVVALAWFAVDVAREVRRIRRSQSFDKHVDEALEGARERHPSRPIGPEDEDRWKEWAR